MAAGRFLSALAHHNRAINSLNYLRQLCTLAVGSIPRTEILPELSSYCAAAHRFGPAPTEIRAGDTPRSYGHLITPICERNACYLRASLHFYCTAAEGSDSEANADGDSAESGDEKRPSNVEVYRRELSPEEVTEAAEIGYAVAGRAKPFNARARGQEPTFAVVQIGSHQFKVSRGDYIYVENLKHADVNDKLILNKVLMLGSKSQTIIGRPILPSAAVHAVVEEQALDATVIIFKKKRRKNYRRTNYHRQELTRLRITGVKGLKESSEANAIAV